MCTQKTLKIITISCLLFLTASPGHTEDISFEAVVDRNTVALGSALNLTLKVTGTQNVAPFDLSQIEDFDARYVGPSKQISIVNGQYTSSVSFNYSLLPLKTGQYQIPPFQATIDGQIYKSEAIPIEVVDAQSPQADQSQVINLEDKVFLVLQTAKKDVFVNERVPVKIMLFVSDVAMRDIQFPQLENIGVKVDDFDKPRQYEQVVKGRRFEIVEFNTAIYPTRVGELKIGPASVEGNLIMRSTRRPGQFGFFDDDFFDGFFDRGQKRPITVRANEAVINVSDVPGEGKPESFKGAVGSFQFLASVGPQKVSVGDPLTLKMQIQGEGNLDAVRFPEVKAGGDFKLYTPNIKEEGNVKTYEQVLIPTSEEVDEVPALEFSYFDSALQKYTAVRRGPFAVEVTPLSEEDQLKVVGLASQAVSFEPEKLGSDVVYLKDNIGRLRTKGEAFYNTSWFYALFVMFWGGWIAAYLFHVRTHRLQTDVAYARRRQAPKYARKGLARARQYLQAGQSGSFYDELFKTLQVYFSHKYHMPAGAITKQTIAENVALKSKDSRILSDIHHIIDECEQVRYASVQLGKEQMAASLAKLEEIIDCLERKF